MDLQDTALIVVMVLSVVVTIVLLAMVVQSFGLWPDGDFWQTLLLEVLL